MPDHRKKLVAYQTSSGAVSGFIQRSIQANPDNTWQQLKEQLSVRFSDVTDRQMTFAFSGAEGWRNDTSVCWKNFVSSRNGILKSGGRRSRTPVN